MPTRTDQHSPANLITEDYEYVFAIDNQSPWARDLDRDFLRELRDGVQRSPLAHRGYGQCHHCGAHLRYAAFLRHLPTGAIIVVGETCLDNRFSLATADFHRLRKAAELDRQAQRIKTAAAEFVSTLDGDLRTAFDRDTVLTEAFPFISEDSYAHATITDIRRKVWNLYGAASERQVAFVGRLITEARDRAAQAAQRAAEVKVEAPEGRIEIEGVVIKKAFYDSEYGGAYKITLKVEDLARGGIWLCFVTEPSKVTTERGDIVRLTANFTRSDRDACFAFGKRPSKAQVIGKSDADLDSLA